MTKNTYAVTVRFGHVGRTKCIIKTIPVTAEDGKAAAEKARWTKRVKHHAKDAILSVTKITEEQYNLLEEIVKNDPYFRCSNVQEQRELCEGIENEVEYMREDEIDIQELKDIRKNKINFKKRKNKALVNDAYRAMRNYRLCMSY